MSVSWNTVPAGSHLSAVLLPKYVLADSFQGPAGNLDASIINIDLANIDYNVYG